MSLLSIILVLVAIGVILYIVNIYIPMDSNVRKILNAVVILILIIWLLKIFGLLAPLESIRIG